MVRSSHALHVLALGLYTGLIASPSFAQSTGEWREVPSVRTPPARTGFGLVRLRTGDLAMVGGNPAVPVAFDWLWDGVDWRPIVSGLPRLLNPAVSSFGEHGALLFGGTTPAGAFVADTWRAFGSQWVPVVSANSPGVLAEMSAAYDVQQDRVVLIGRTPAGDFETWFFVLSTGWQQGPTFSAAAAHVVCDEIRRETLLLTGRLPQVKVERLEDADWQSLSETQQSFLVGEVAFDSHRGRVVAAQPYDSREVVEWDGLGFGASPVPTGSFVPTTRTAMAYHERRSELVMVTNYAGEMQTWRYLDAPVAQAQSYGSDCFLSTQIDLAAGDVPQPGASHRLELTGGNGNFATFAVFGFSHVENQGLPLPQPIPIGPFGCFLRVEASAVVFLGSGLPQSTLLTLPFAPELLGERYDAQGVLFDASAVIDTSNGLEVQIGSPQIDQVLTETFVSDANRDELASGGTWRNGELAPAQIGGDGRHGSFDATLGQLIEPGVYEWSTDGMLIPGNNTLSGEDEVVTDGRFYFTDFVVPAGVTVRFVGSVAAQVRVRGRVDVLGHVSVDAADMPFTIPAAGLAQGERVSTFDARGSNGQPGGQGGAGGGRGGNGAVKCLNAGPILDNGVALTDGQPGESVQVSAAHAYAGNAVGTGGSGSPMNPEIGVFGPQVSSQLIGNIYSPHHSSGGAGGGFHTAGGSPAAMAVPGLVQPISLPPANGGSAFPTGLPALPPAGYSSLEHFSVGGSGGGGGGSHVFGEFGFGAFERWMAGHGGTGGGGVLVLRSGADMDVAGLISARGGRGVIVNGDDPATLIADISFRISSPGGGGSGGSVLLQSAENILYTGQLDASGSDGSRNDLIARPQLNGQGGGGAGADGQFRFETGGVSALSGLAIPSPSSADFVDLTDSDARSGARSRWLLPASGDLPIYVRYELLVEIGGLPVLMSDDPSVSPLAADSGAVQLRFQGARIDPLTGQPDLSAVGPWRTTLRVGDDSVNRDRAQTLRFDIVFDGSVSAAKVLELRIVWR